MVVDTPQAGSLGALVKAIRKLVLITGVLLYFATNVVVGALLHLDLPITRAAVARLVEKSVSDSLRGGLHIRKISRLAETGILLEGVEIRDPSNRAVITVRELEANVNPIGIAQRLLAGNEKLSIEVSEVRIEGFEVFLLRSQDRDEKGKRLTHLSLSDAFEVLPSKEGKSYDAGKQVRIWFPRVDLIDVYTRGSIEGSDTFEAEVHHARASVLATDRGAAIDVQRFEISTTGLLGIDTLAHGEVHVRAPGSVWGMIGGTIGKIPFKQDFRFAGNDVEVKGNLPRLEPTLCGALVEDWPLDQVISIENRISGTLPDLQIELSAKGSEQDGVWPGSIEAKGRVHLSDSPQAKINITTHSLNLASLHSEIPQSVIDSETVLTATFEKAKLQITASSIIKPGVIAEIATPSIELETSVNGTLVVADALIEEQGLSARIHAENEENGLIRFEVIVPDTRIANSPRLRQLLPDTEGRFEAKFKGVLDDDELTTSGNLRASQLRSGRVKLASASVSITTATDLKAPADSSGGIKASAEGFVAGALSLNRLTLNSSGPVYHPRIEIVAHGTNNVKFTTSGELNVKKRELFKFQAQMTGRGKAVEAKARYAALGDSRLIVSDFVVRSIGEISGDVDLGLDGGTIALKATGLDLSRIGQALGYARSEIGGNLDADINLEVGNTAQGSVMFEVQNGAFFGITGVEVDARSDFNGRNVEGQITAAVSELGTVSSSWDGKLGGSPLSKESYLDSTGRLKLRLGELDLHTLTLLGKSDKWPKLDGYLNLELEAKRASRNHRPSLDFNAATRDLIVEYKGERVSGINFNLAAKLSEDSEDIETALHITDRHGPLTSLSGEVSLPLAAWAKTPPNDIKFREWLSRVPFKLVAVIPERKLSDWPPFIPRIVDDGSFSARVVLDGTLLSPKVDLLIEAKKLQGGQSHFAEPLDLKLGARYVADTGALRGKLSAERAAQRFSVIHYDLVVPFSHLFNTPAEDVPLWTGTAQLLLESSPLLLLQELKETGLRGRAQGSIELKRSALLPEISGELQLRNLRVHKHRLGDARIDLQTHDTDLIARAEFSDDFGSLRLSAELGLVATSLFARPAAHRAIFLSLQSEQYNAAVLAPFVSEVFDEFSGNLNGQLRAELQPPERHSKDEKGRWKTSFSGNLELKDGVFMPAVLGQRLTDTQFGLKASSEGDVNVVRLEHFVAKADSDKHNLKGEGEFIFTGFSLDSGQFRLTPDKVPFFLEGAKMAELTGEARARFQLNDEAMNIEMNIDDLTAKLAESSDSNLISLEENSNISILQAETRDEDVAELSDKTFTTNLIFRLGENVRVKGTGLDVRLTGAPELRIADKTELRGEIEFIRGGRFQIMGRGFTLEPGAVTFDTGDSTNPHINAAATWTAPNGVIVRMSVRGTLQNPVLEWSSEPALPGGEGEVLSLVLGGGGNADQSTVSSASIAIAANEALGASGVSGVQVYMTQQDGGGEGRMASMTESNWSNYTAAIRLSEDLWFEGSLQKGSTGFQSTERTGVSGTLDWRFHPQWSARTEVGSLGAALDLLWRYRY